MKTIGLIGGMSWESTVSYYQALNQGVRRQLGGLHSAKICLFSVDFDEIEKLQHQDNWQQAANILITAAKAIEAGGADFFLICTNTMHKVAAQVQSAVNIPLLHIADATATALTEHGIKRVGLLGTKFTMEQGFYKHRISDIFDIEVLIPSEDDRSTVHKVIYEELCLGKINGLSLAKFLEIIDNLHAQGAEAIILGCTEIALLVKQQHTNVPLFDTTQIHASRAVEMALDNEISGTNL